MSVNRKLRINKLVKIKSNQMNKTKIKFKEINII